MPSWEPVPAYTMLCQQFREDNNSRDCSWNVITTVWEARGLQAYGGNGANSLVIRVEHRGILENSATFERAFNNVVSNRVFKREYTGQPYDFFSSSIIISCVHKKLLGETFIGQVQLGVLDVFLSPSHMLPMQWFPIVDPNSDLPSEPLGYLKLNCIINNFDESGAVQPRAPDDVADWELNRHEILQIPRLNLRKCAAHQYNLKFMTFQGFDLGTGAERTADPVFKVMTPCGVIATDPVPNTLKPHWNAMLQIPFYEPTFSDLIVCEVWDGSYNRLSRLYFSWKDLFINQQSWLKPRWIDMYERKYNFLNEWQIPIQGQTISNVMEQAGVSGGGGMFEERSIYCGRVLLSVEIEERFKKEPSPANIALKKKDTDAMWSDAMQKMYFRFHCFYGQDFSVDGFNSRVQIEFQVGRKSVTVSPAELGDKGLYEFFQAVECEYELPFDDLADNPDGEGKPSMGAGKWRPETFIERLPQIWIKAYKVSLLSGVTNSKELIGMWRGEVKTALGGGDPEEWQSNCFVGTDAKENCCGMQGIQPIIIPFGEEPPEPTRKCPWGSPDDEVTQKILNPYLGYQYVQLSSDSSCSLGADEPAGFVGFSVKLWLPDRYKCANGPPKGPPILSPWTAWNAMPIPRPWSDMLRWSSYFCIRGHIYQAKSLGARNDTGVANAFVELRFLNQGKTQTHTVFLTNNPTFDMTLNLNDQELFLLPDDHLIGIDEYCLNAEDAADVRTNWKMLNLAPRFEVRVYEKDGETDILLGRTYISPTEVLARKTNPKPLELFKGNPDIVEGYLLASFQVIESNEKIMKEPPAPLVPDDSQPDMDKEDTWTSKAPVKKVAMMECKIQIQVLGLRDLTSPYPMGLQIVEPQIEICCDDPKTASTTKSSKAPSGPNANFMECVEIEVSMPVARAYAPFLDFYVYDHSTMGLPEMPWAAQKPPIVAYGSMATEDFYPSDQEDMSDIEGDEDEEDEEAQEKRRQKERKKKFENMVKELKRDGVLNGKEAKTLGELFIKKDEAVTRAFEQYIDAPDSMKFIERIEGFILQTKKEDDQAKKKAEDKKKAEAEKARKEKEKLEALKKKKEEEEKAQKLLEAGDGDDGDAGPDAADDAPDGAGYDAADMGAADDDEGGDAQDGEDDMSGDEIADADAVEGEDDMLPDMQEKVDTPDGKPNPEWLLLRAHPIYDCPLEASTVKEYGKKGAWEPRFADAFDELTLFRGPIKNFKQVHHESVGILKCKVKLFQKESEEVAEARGEEARYLDMAELKKGKEVPYAVPDVNENYQQRDIEIRVYLLKAFQMTPVQVIDGIAKSDNFVKVSLGDEEWDWRIHYDPVIALNPQFYRCAKVSAKLPGPSQLHIALLDDGGFGPVTDLAMSVGLGDGSTEIGETVVDLEDRWFCEEWRDKTVHKPRETRDLFSTEKPGISVGKLMVFVDAVLRVDVDDKPEKDINIAGRQMPLEMRLIVWNIRSCSPKDGYTSNVKMFAELLGWGRMKETDVDFGVKVGRNAMFNYRIKFKGIKFPSPDPTIPAKDFLLKMQIWAHRILGNDEAIAEGVLPLQPLFQDCMQRNLGKPSPDDMEIVTLEPDGDKLADEEGNQYPFKWFKLCHPGGPGCKNNKDFRPPGYNFAKNYQCEVQITVQVMPRAKARAMPASLGFKPGPAKMFAPDRPPQPTNPIFDPEGCKAYIVYTCKEAFNKKKPCCICLSCCIIIVAGIVLYAYLAQAGLTTALAAL